jgi:hypothetical protein
MSWSWLPSDARLGDFGNVSESGAADGDALIYDAATGSWLPGEGSASPAAGSGGGDWPSELTVRPTVDGAPLTLYVNGPQAVYDPATLRTFYVWSGAGRDLYAGYYDHLTGQNAPPVLVAANPLAADNDHGAPSIAIGPDGILYVSWGSHNSAFRLSKTAAPRDISSWTTTNTGVGGTYTWMLVRPNGDLLVFYRANTHSQWAFVRSTDGGATWSAATAVLTMGGAPESHVDVYLMGLTPIGDRLHISWLLSRNSTHDGGRRDVYHAVYDLEAGTLATVDGTSLPVPLTWADEAQVRVATAAPVWQLQHLVRRDGRVHIAFTTGTDGSGEAGTYTVHVVTWDGAAWSTVDTGIPQAWRWSGLALREWGDAVVGLFCNRTGSRTDLGVWTSGDGAAWYQVDAAVLPGTGGEGIERLGTVRSGPWLTLAQPMPSGWARTSATVGDLLPLSAVTLAGTAGGGGSPPTGDEPVASDVVIEEADTDTLVWHDLPRQPTIGEVQLTPVDDVDGWLDGAASTRYAVRDLGADTFTVAVDPAPGVGKHVRLGWLWIPARQPAPPPAEDYRGEIVSDSPLAYWRLGETSGTAAADEMAFENGVYSNSPTLGVAGVTDDGDTAVTFNGTNQQMSVAYRSAWNTSALTVEAWIKTTATGVALIVSRDNGTNGHRDFQFRIDAGKVQFVNMRGNGVGATTVASAGTVNDGAWHHVVAVRDGSTVTLYIDGVQDGHSTAMQAPHLTGTSRIAVATNANNAAWLAGTLDEVAYYGTALAAARVAAHFAASGN